jgi:CelD/BcsL family acetyltransferase involved in cellulose biosynthesis
MVEIFWHRQTLGGFDLEFSRSSLGTLIIVHPIEQAWREGALPFDFLRGEESYKYLWGAKNSATVCRSLYPKSCHAANESL